jgi:hypothetical protein
LPLLRLHLRRFGLPLHQRPRQLFLDQIHLLRALIALLNLIQSVRVSACNTAAEE